MTRLLPLGKGRQKRTVKVSYQPLGAQPAAVGEHGNVLASSDSSAGEGSGSGRPWGEGRSQ